MFDMKNPLLQQDKAVSLELQLFEIYVHLKWQPTLEPNSMINFLFEKLVEKISKATIEQEDVVLNSKILELLKPGLNTLCERAEGLLEKHWAKQFLSVGPLCLQDLASFPYFTNYQLLSDWELSLVTVYLGFAPKKILFVGSGCLPLSALLLSERSDLMVDCLEIDEESAKLSTSLIQKLGLYNQVKVIHNDFFRTKDFSHYDVVIVAALVGNNELEKRDVLCHLKENLASGKSSLIRSATGLKKLLYQEVNPAWLADFKEVQLHHPPSPEIINSVILAKK